MSDETLFTKKMKTPDGMTIYYFNNPDRRVFHNWDGPAIKYSDNRKDEYYIFGRQMTKDEWAEVKRDFNGLPPAKDPNYKNAFVH